MSSAPLEATSDLPTSSSAGSLAKTQAKQRPIALASTASEAASTTSSSASSTRSHGSSTKANRDGSASRTQSDSSSPTRGETWRPWSGDWKTSGMGGPTGWWTGDISDQPSDAVESSLLDIVEVTVDPHGTCWLTTTAAASHLKYATNNGAKPDPRLEASLRTMVEG